MKLFRDSRTVTPEVADVLCEIGNVGVGKATDKLSRLMGKRIILRTPHMLSLNSGLDAVSDMAPDQVAVGILMRMTAELEGIVLVLLDTAYVSELVLKLTGVYYPGEHLVEDENSLSVVHEIANILAASYMNAIGSYTSLRIYLTPMMVGLDMAAALVSYPLAEMSISGENVVGIDSSFSTRPEVNGVQACEGRILIMPNEKSVKKIMDALGL